MCGIAGILARTAHPTDWVASMVRLSNTLQHRGPDGEGFVVINDTRSATCYGGSDTQADVARSSYAYSPTANIAQHNGSFRLGLLHRRLAIIDTSPIAHQPMCGAANWLTFNGEIYNWRAVRTDLEALGFQFATNTDTEVVLAAYSAWGRACVQRFNGMWAFALYDAARQELFCSRDRFGVKPFYYTAAPHYWAFASEQKALLQLPDTRAVICQAAAFDYLAMGRTEAEPQGMLLGILELPPAHNLVYDLTQNTFFSYGYYELTYQTTWQPFGKHAFEIATERVRNLLEQSVALRLKAAVTVGATLSGGLDSSILVSMAHWLEPQKKMPVFTTCFEGFEGDETKWANIVTEHTGSLWQQSRPTSAGLLADIEQLVWAHDEPVLGASSYSHYALMQTVKAAGIKIALEGQGADELFGGYPPHFAVAAFDALRNGAAGEVYAAMRANTHGSFANKKNALLLPPKVLLARWLTGTYCRAFRQNNTAYSWLRNDFWATNAHRLQAAKHEHPLQLNALLHREFTGTTLKFLLRAGDRNGMAHGVESRMPFTDDHELVEYVMHLPAAFKIRHGISKHLLREATQPILPPAIYQRSDKVGFATPEQQWLHAHADHWLTYFTDDMNDYIDVAALRKGWKTTLANTPQGNTHRLWRLLNFAIWRKVFRAE